MEATTLGIWAKLKAVLTRDLGGPSLMPTSMWKVRRGFWIVLVVSLAVLAVDQAWLWWPSQPYVSPPTPTPTAAPHFALDDVNLGPDIQLTRFYPNDNFWDGNAVEAGDGQLYVGYGAGLSPAQWGMEVPCCTEVGILTQGRMTPIQFSTSAQRAAKYYVTAVLEGVWHGMPIVHVRDGTEAGDRYVAISATGIEPLRHRPSVSKRSSQCIDFDDGRVCNIMSDANWEVSISLPGRDSLLVKGARYANGPPYSGSQDTGNIKLIGGGRHHFLMVEYHIGQDAAECLEGDAP